MRSRTLPAALVGILLLLGLAGCSLPLPSPSGPSPDPVETTGPAPSTPPTPTPPTPPATGGPSGTASPNETGPPAVGALGPAVGSRTSADRAGSVTIELYRIVRSGDLAYLTLAARSPDEVPVGGMFSSAGSAGYAADGITLVDSAHKRLYLTASRGTGEGRECICTEVGQLTLGDQPAIITAAFAAPPVGVKELDVQVPHFGVFPRVPVV